MKTFHIKAFSDETTLGNPAGINEDPVTGLAGAGLLRYLHTKDKKIHAIKVEQGHFVNMKGRIFISFNSL